MNPPPPVPPPPMNVGQQVPGTGQGQPPVAGAIRFLTIFVWVVTAMGGLLLLFGIYFLWDGYQSALWPSVEGRVVRTRVRLDIANSNTSRTSIRGTRRYYAEVTYRYEVGGTAYTSRRYAFGESREKHLERAVAEADAANFPVGTTITVYYDPDDPSSAVLVAGAGIGAWVPLLMGVGFLGLGSLMLVMIAKGKPIVRVGAAQRPEDSVFQRKR